LQGQLGLINSNIIANFNPENSGIGTLKSRDFGIPGSRD